MPVNKTLYNALKKQYGPKKAVAIYSAMEKDKTPAFQKGLKTAEKEKHVLKKLPKAKR